MNEDKIDIRKIRLKYLLLESIVFLLMIGSIFCFVWINNIWGTILSIATPLVLFGILMALKNKCASKIKSIAYANENQKKEFDQLSRKVYHLSVMNGIKNLDKCNDSDLLLIAKQFDVRDLSLARQLYKNGESYYMQIVYSNLVEQAESY